MTIYSNRKLDYLNKINGKNFEVKYCDITDASIYDELVDNDMIYHLAQINLGVTKSTVKDYTVNSLPCAKIVESCIKNNKKPKIVFASSYNLTRTNESSPPSIWSLHKSFGEQYLGFYSDYHQANILNVRIANVYGVPVNIKKINNSSINNICKIAKTGKICLYKNSNLMRSFIHVDDLVNCLFTLQKFSKFDFPLICYASEMKLLNYEEIAQMLIDKNKLNGIKTEIQYSCEELNRIEMYSDKTHNPNIFNILGLKPKWNIHKFVCNNPL